ncbi:MAG: hypothetical protein QUS14_18690 [Pyrinomonadaceae bacterium]|nr:hypothetical protein [Pyrinomonadaceae bacterium]
MPQRVELRDGADAFELGNVYPWNDVAKIHRSRNGIYQKDGRLVSLLTDFGRINPCYPDFHGDSRDVIHYTGSGRRGDQKLDAANSALIDAIRSGHAVPLFNKLGVNRWEFLGFWAVTESRYIYDESRERMVWKFTLRRSSE